MKTKTICALLLLCTLLCLTVSCAAPEQKLLGTWENEATALGISAETTFEFKEDGSGVKTAPLGIATPFTYVFEGEQLLLTFDVLGIKTTYRYSYVFHSNDALTLTKEGEVIELTRVK